jgi:Domain of Unknown Function with PDB structure (DUF3857)/Transglutaminase-like superfamily
MRILLIILCTATFLVSPALAQNKEVKRGPSPSWVAPSELLAVPENAKGLIFFRRQDILMQLNNNGQLHYTGYRAKLLHPNALQIGNLSITWNPASGAPTVHTIKIYRGAETIDALKKSTFEILRREDQLEAAKLDGMLTAALRISDLRVGDELEVEFTTPSNDLTLGDKSAGLLFLGQEPPAGRYQLGLYWDQNQKPTIKATPDMLAMAKQSSNAIEVRFDNPPKMTPPKDAPNRYQWQRILEFSDFTDWASISRHFAPLFLNASKFTKNSPIKQEAERIAKEHVEPLERARAALKLVQNDIRYIYVGLGTGNLTPASAEETWQRRYGDCKGKTALLLGLLNELGIEAKAVLVNNQRGDDGLNERLPNPGMFDHVLVNAQIDGKTYWMDGTLPAVARPSIEPIIPYKWVLPLTQTGSTLEAIAWHPKKEPDEISLYEIDARAGFDTSARIVNTKITRGIKGLQEQFEFSALTQQQILSTFQQQAIGDTWHTIDDVQWNYDEKAQASILTIIGKGDVDWDDEKDGAKSLTLPGGGFNPPERRVRSAEQNQEAPFYSVPTFNCNVTSVRLPEKTQSKNWSFNEGFDTRVFGHNYYRAFELRAGTIRMIRGSRTEKPEIDAALAKQDNARISSFDNSMASIDYNPTEETFYKNDQKQVPATFDLDWTKDSTSCLASDKDR